jgi:hypothetical protein
MEAQVRAEFQHLVKRLENKPNADSELALAA